MKIYVYIITNRKTKQCYVGQTTNVKRRWRRYHTYRKKKSRMRIVRAIHKHGIHLFEFRIEGCYTKRWADKVERKLIENYRKLGLSYNTADGGFGGSYKGHCGHKKKKLTIEWRKNISLGCRGVKHPWSDEAKRNYVSHLKGKKLSKMHRLNISKAVIKRWRKFGKRGFGI